MKKLLAMMMVLTSVCLFAQEAAPAEDSRPAWLPTLELSLDRSSRYMSEGNVGNPDAIDTLSLTLLRAPTCPDPDADRGEHDFTYAVTVWEGSFLDSPVVREAAEEFRSVAENQGKKLYCHVQEPLILKSDVDRLKQLHDQGVY